MQGVVISRDLAGAFHRANNKAGRDVETWMFLSESIQSERVATAWIGLNLYFYRVKNAVIFHRFSGYSVDS